MQGNSALHVAVQANSKALSRILMNEQSLNPNIQNFEGNSPLHIAVEKSKDLVILENLLRLKNIEANLKNNIGETPLLMAARIQKEGPVRLLASHPTSLIEDRELERIKSL